MHAARFGSEGCVLRLLSHGAARYKKDKAGRMTASDLAIAAGHLHIAGIVSADPKWLDLMEIAAQVNVPYYFALLSDPLLLLSCGPRELGRTGNPPWKKAVDYRMVRLFVAPFRHRAEDEHSDRFDFVRIWSFERRR